MPQTVSSTSAASSTRQKILHIAAEEIHLHGFQACNTSAIIDKAGISKGALYHHFENKQALGYAVVNEVFAPDLLNKWQGVFDSNNPVPVMIQLFREALSWMDFDSISRGCPINNLAQEMSPIDEGFRLCLRTVITDWQKGIEQALRLGQQHGHVKADIDAERTAIFLVASIEGGYGLAKNTQDLKVFASCVHALIDYLEHLQGADT